MIPEDDRVPSECPAFMFLRELARLNVSDSKLGSSSSPPVLDDGPNQSSTIDSVENKC
jgi:hypothetical protein